MCGISFKQTFIDQTRDKVLDKAELAALKQKAAEVKAADPGSADAALADQVINNLDKIKDTTSMKYTLKGGSSDANMVLDFDFTPTYSEKDKVAGKTMEEKISNLSQGDTLSQTKSDNDRCGAATMVNIALRTLAAKNPGKTPDEVFAIFAKQVGVPAEFTYENVHKAQDKLYNEANTDGKKGLSAGYNYKMDQSGTVSSASTTGEVKKIADKLGLKTETLIGPDKNNLDDKKAAVDNFFANNPKGSVMVGVCLNDDGEIVPADANNPQNHFVEVYKKDGEFYMKDTGATSNGNGNGDKKLDSQAKEGFLYKNPGITIGVS